MKIAVFGLGYVGVVNVACLSKLGYTVYCTDVKKHKVQLVTDGKSPILEPEVEDLINIGVKKNVIVPTNDIRLVIDNSDVIIICVGTPSKLNGEVNLDYLKNVLIEITSYLKNDDKKYIVFRSTVPPGTTEELIREFIDKRFLNIKVVFYPEFLREGSAVKDFFNYGRFVLGYSGKNDIDDLINLLNVNKECPMFITDYKTAEYSKYIDNSFHALKVVFSNEIFGLGAELGINVSDAYNIFIADDKLNISHRYLKPGNPFGGSCLPKDVREIQHLKLRSDRVYKILENIIPSNIEFINYIYDKIIYFKTKRIAFVGLTFKNYSDDLRESPMLGLFQRLRDCNCGYELTVYDEDINIDNVRVEFPYLFVSIKGLKEAISSAEIIIVSKRYLESVLELRDSSQIILNLSNITTADKAENIYNIYNKD